jgi:hypothetical protein
VNVLGVILAVSAGTALAAILGRLLNPPERAAPKGCRTRLIRTEAAEFIRHYRET